MRKAVIGVALVGAVALGIVAMRTRSEQNVATAPVAETAVRQDPLDAGCPYYTNEAKTAWRVIIGAARGDLKGEFDGTLARTMCAHLGLEEWQAAGRYFIPEDMAAEDFVTKLLSEEARGPARWARGGGTMNAYSQWLWLWMSIGDDTCMRVTSSLCGGPDLWGDEGRALALDSYSESELEELAWLSLRAIAVLPDQEKKDEFVRAYCARWIHGMGESGGDTAEIGEGRAPIQLSSGTEAELARHVAALCGKDFPGKMGWDEKALVLRPGWKWLIPEVMGRARRFTAEDLEELMHVGTGVSPYAAVALARDYPERWRAAREGMEGRCPASALAAADCAAAGPWNEELRQRAATGVKAAVMGEEATEVADAYRYTRCADEAASDMLAGMIAEEVGASLAGDFVWRVVVEEFDYLPDAKKRELLEEFLPALVGKLSEPGEMCSAAFAIQALATQVTARLRPNVSAEIVTRAYDEATSSLAKVSLIALAASLDLRVGQTLYSAALEDTSPLVRGAGAMYAESSQRLSALCRETLVGDDKYAIIAALWAVNNARMGSLTPEVKSYLATTRGEEAAEETEVRTGTDMTYGMGVQEGRGMIPVLGIMALARAGGEAEAAGLMESEAPLARLTAAYCRLCKAGGYDLMWLGDIGGIARPAVCVACPEGEKRPSFVDRFRVGDQFGVPLPFPKRPAY